MRAFSLYLLVAALISAGPISAERRCSDLALVLAVDSSSSIDEDEFRMQVLGYAAAFTDPKVQRALRAAGTVDVASVFWADSAIPPMISKWTRISNDADAAAFADTFLIFQRSAFGDTELGAGLMAALDLFDMPGQCSARSVVNVSGDGRASIGNRRAAHKSVAEARARAEAMGVTVNGLAIVNAEPTLAEYYRTQVITGPGAFVKEARDFRAFGDAIVQKLEREIQPQLSASLGPHPLH
jgi:hypothetical protein